MHLMIASIMDPKNVGIVVITVALAMVARQILQILTCLLVLRSTRPQNGDLREFTVGECGIRLNFGGGRHTADRMPA